VAPAVLHRGLVVAVKVVSVGDPSNERAVMKNAHEIAILRSSSHPNIIQAYSCLTDVRIQDVIVLCTRWGVGAEVHSRQGGVILSIMCRAASRA
jgi:serine/threonine protein kinase